MGMGTHGSRRLGLVQVQVQHSAEQEQGEVPRKAEFPNSLLWASRARAMLI